MARIRIEFTKGEPVRFLSHLELAKTFERALRRAGLPIAFSEGFNPHPRISFASALAVGVTSAGEIMEVELTQDLPPGQVANRLGAELPPGLEINRAALADPQAPALMALINRAEYQVLVEVTGTLPPEVLAGALEKFLALDSVLVEKFSKKGHKEVNIRPGIFAFQGEVLGGTARFVLELLTGSSGSVRPEDVLRALVQQFPLPLDLGAMVIHRTGLAIADEKGTLAPFEAGLLKAE